MNPFRDFILANRKRLVVSIVLCAVFASSFLCFDVDPRRSGGDQRSLHAALVFVGGLSIIGTFAWKADRAGKSLQKVADSILMSKSDTSIAASVRYASLWSASPFRLREVSLVSSKGEQLHLRTVFNIQYTGNIRFVDIVAIRNASREDGSKEIYVSRKDAELLNVLEWDALRKVVSEQGAPYAKGFRGDGRFLDPVKLA